MTESKSIDRIFNPFPSKLFRDDTEGGGGLTWSNFNHENNALVENSKLLNSNFFFTKMENALSVKNENGAEPNFNRKIANNSNSMFGFLFHDDEPNNVPSDRIFNHMSKMPENSAFMNQSNNMSVMSFTDTMKSRMKNEAMADSNNNIKEEQLYQSYFPFVVEYRKMLPPLKIEEEPIYVNAKQYERIMKMRLKRAKAGLLRGSVRNSGRTKDVSLLPVYLIPILILCVDRKGSRLNREVNTQ